MSGHWSLFVFLVVNCRFGVVLPRCEEFHEGPPATVVIPEGGGTSLFCERGAGQGRLDWFTDNSMIRGHQDRCDCAGVIISTDRINLTFTNFRSEQSAARYGCWAAIAGGYEECNFEVMVAVSPQVAIIGVSGDRLMDALVITPTIVRGLPEAAITWSLGGGVSGASRVLDPNDPRVTISSEGALTVTDVQASDRGVYTVRATNIAEPGGVEASVNVKINFVDVEGPTFTYSGEGDFVVGCVATGYPGPVTATLSPEIGSTSDSENTESDNAFHVVRSIGRAFPTCTNTTYTCSAMSGDESSRSTKTTRGSASCVGPTGTPDPPLPAPTNLMVEQQGDSLTEVRVSWTAPDGLVGGYRVRYTNNTSNGSETIDFVGETFAVITGLMAGINYQFSVATLRDQGDTNTNFSLVVPFFVPCPLTTVPRMPIRGIRAILYNDNGRRTLSVSWTASSEIGVEMYRVGVGVSTDPQTVIREFTMTDMLMYTLSPEFCNGSTYRFTVIAIDRCGKEGPPGASVSKECSSAGDNVATFGFGDRQPSSIELIITHFMSTMPLSITATTLRPKNGTQFISSVYTVSPPVEGSICIGGLLPGTFYNICLSTASTPRGSEVCLQESTASPGTGTSAPEQCLSPVSTDFTVDTRRTASSFPDWAIAVIVVGVFALVALLFCFIGLCFACNTNNKDYDGDSVSSLQTASIPAGPSPYVTNHRNNPSSPQHRSCLSYHRGEGHSTNWNEHRNTLRQMDTDGGTHV